jgi:lysophospholipase L1-like esterase
MHRPEQAPGRSIARTGEGPKAKEGGLMKGLVRSLLILVLLLFGAVTAAPAAAQDAPTTPVAPLQLSLGDSWAFGFGASMPSVEGYVPQLNEALQEDFNCSGAGPEESQAGCPQLELRNLAVGGATTPSMIAGQFPQAIPLLESRNGNLNPRDDVELVTLHIGGNDVTNPIIAACLGGLTPSCLQVIQTEFAAYESDLDAALSTLREAAGADAPIVIGTYDNPIATCFLAAFPGAVQLGAVVLEGGPGVPQGLHDIIREVAARYDIQVAEVFGDLGPQDWVGGSDCLHPDDSGYDKVTVAFLEVLGLD